MKTPEKNAAEIMLKSYTLINIPYIDSVLSHCDDAIETIIDYHNSILKLREETEAEALVFENKIKFWVDTKEEIKKFILKK